MEKLLLFSVSLVIKNYCTHMQYTLLAAKFICFNLVRLFEAKDKFTNV